MSKTSRNERPLARLRDDLEISVGAPFLSGAPGWVIRDPVRHRFYQIGQRTIDVLSRWSAGSVDCLKARLFAEKAIQLSDDELEALVRFLQENQLLEGGEKGSAKRFAQMSKSGLISLFWLHVPKILFFRVPLVRPDRFLRATWPFVSPLFSAAFVWLSLVVLLSSIYLASRQLSDIEAHFREAFTWSGAVLFLLAIAFVKVLHELGHAYQAVGRGLRVPVMGVAFFAFFPLLYTDATDAWRLRRRTDRVMVDLGGILVELAVAVYATLLWCFLPDGPARSVAFAIATSSWVVSLVVNLNPFMRFDGYYLLADSLGIQNLQTRSFKLARWAMRRTLFGFDDPAPEAFAKSTCGWLIAYAFGIWVYRFFLFLTIALLVYTMFFKLAGVLLAAIAVGAFIVRPILAEIRFWVGARDRIRGSWRSFVTLSCALAAVAAFFWPVSSQIQVPAVLEASDEQAIFPPEASRLEAIFITEGQTVARGAPLFQFANPELRRRIQQSRTRIAMHNARLLSIAGDDVERADSPVIARALDEEAENLTTLQDRQNKLRVVAAMDGEIRELSTDLDPGIWYPRTHLLGRIIDPGSLLVRGYMSEADFERMDPSRPATFIADEVSIPKLELQGVKVSDFSIERLRDGYLARPFGGPIAVSNSDPEALIVGGVWYPIFARLPADNLPAGLVEDRVQRGVIAMRSVPQSMAFRLGQRIARVLIRELQL